MTGLDSLYQELILDHSKHPVGNPLHDVGDAAHADSHQKNPVCGDEITLRVAVDGDRITEVSWEGTGCSISQAS
ncbi:MAG: system NifU family Fe-S cluster assembly protein, partial [Microbacterium sp.]|nr:system NifU family Fe-S cluster assembly protein [Microbacterium sp.]